MPLQKSKGHMYPWVSHTHSHLGGECPHKCVYCYVDHFPFGRPQKYQGELRLIEKEFSVNYGSGKTIFVENCNDLFAEEVPQEFIERILAHCRKYPDNTYIFQTKNPARYITAHIPFPTKSLLGCTLETNRTDCMCVSNAPAPVSRIWAMEAITRPKFITIEPILDFDVIELITAILSIKPNFVNIGSDSKGHGLREPSIDKVNELISLLRNIGIEVREKHNLQRLKKKGEK